MLIICNGAIKSGSTWLFNILVNLVSVEKPDDKYLTLNNPRHPCISVDKMLRFLEAEDYGQTNYISKNHIDNIELRNVLVKDENIFVFDIERDPKDVVVSHFYHERFRNGFEGSFDDFYWRIGREVAASLAAYHELWRNAGPRVYISSYEALHQDFAAEVTRIAAILEIEPSAAQLIKLHEKTAIKTLRKNYKDEPRFEGEKFFRKGKVGDWKNHFDERKLADINDVCERGFSGFDIPHLLNRMRSIWR